MTTAPFYQKFIPCSKILNKKNWNKYNNVYLSDRININNLSITINDQTKNIKDFRLFQYRTFHYVYKDIDKQTFAFISPKKWKDPFEKNSLLDENIFCICTKYLSSINEEASWTQYSIDADTPLVRLSYKFDELIDLLNQLGLHHQVDFYIGVIDYSLDRKNISKQIAHYKRISNSLTIDDKLSLMCLKRSAFAYEKEIRIFAVPKCNNKNTNKWVNEEVMTLSLKPINKNWNSIIGSIILPPLRPINDTQTTFESLQKIINAGMEDYLNAILSNKQYTRPKMSSKVVNSALYRE